MRVLLANQNWGNILNENDQQLSDEVFVISGIFQGRGKCYQPSRRVGLLTLTETWII